MKKTIHGKKGEFVLDTTEFDKALKAYLELCAYRAIGGGVPIPNPDEIAFAE